ncbi:hypothetical protein [Rhizobium leguminosarum]|jgi:hypothetical protein|uniref:CD-NTase-associated protein 12/Pycsar effector protein TIR domain-containing protein n=1 Tax=Rhizobium leguminosarum TaxID=384 RepID=A0ABD7PP03_RHILE|nr:hypothetical protein [Rhizobium leguminosarum]TAV73174.1 hypothetical protein ELI28_06480 [Rhizobium leguminosarum]TAV77774.1 hypothetical protein ELI27_06480 [Rhizobium leguminosarum]TAW29153.1 hypothetical protein ELI19_06455 [Rhizobium leguminosarum]TAW42881.1 hypothetical protein ELI18_06395 [Rhizobium leguminosarum]TAX33973.1 hypothetical protein ELI06_06415 [Rhizobium leguminosarum]
MAIKPAKKKLCFVVGPIGDDDSDDRIHADWLLEDIITPVFDEHFEDFEVTRADKISNPGQITSQVITSLLDAELVIADLTTLNPNAFYEIGIRHTIQKPIIHMHLEGQRIPFDIAPFRSIKFSRRRPVDIRGARTALLAAVQEATKDDHEVDNPVTFSRGKVEFEKTATPTERLLTDQIGDVRARLEFIEGYVAGGVTISRNTINYDSFEGSNVNRLLALPRKIAIVVRARSRNMSVNTFLKMVDEWASKAFESFNLEPSDQTGREIVISVSDTREHRGRAEMFRETYHTKEIQVSVGYPKDE